MGQLWLRMNLCQLARLLEIQTSHDRIDQDKKFKTQNGTDQQNAFFRIHNANDRLLNLNRQQHTNTDTEISQDERHAHFIHPQNQKYFAN